MKKAGIFILPIIILLFSFCGTNEENKKTPNPPKEIQSIKIESDLFEIIAPEINSNKYYQVFVIIDPHADGKLASSKFKDVSEEYNVIIIGLNNVENNIPNYINRIDNAVNVLKTNKVKIDKIFIAGFSGGARMALAYALKKNTSGLIMCGAGVGNISNIALPFSTVLISGTRDFNFVEQYYSPYSNLVKNKNLLSLAFAGIHEWPSEDLLLKASGFLLSNSGIEINNKTQKLSTDTVAVLLNKADYLSFKILEANYKINNNTEGEQYLLNMLNSKQFKKYTQKLEQELQNEMQRNQELVQNLEIKSFSWWQSKINEIVKISETNKNNIIADSYARTKAFIGILMFSKVNTEIRNPNSNQIEKYLKIYEYAEPDNPDVQKFKEQYKFGINN